MTENKETNVSSEDQNLSQEALDAANKETPADEPQVPLHEHTALRTKKQAAELEAAELRGQIVGMQKAQAQTAPAVKGPLELEIERQRAEGIADDDMQVSPVIINKNDAWKQQQTNAATKATATQQRRLQQSASKTKAMAAHDDFNEVVLAGQDHLTQGELLDLENAGVDFGEQCFSKCKAAAERVKPEPKPDPKPAPNKDESKSVEEIAAAKAAEEGKVQSQEEILKQADPVAARAASL